MVLPLLLWWISSWRCLSAGLHACLWPTNVDESAGTHSAKGACMSLAENPYLNACCSATQGSVEVSVRERSSSAWESRSLRFPRVDNHIQPSL